MKYAPHQIRVVDEQAALEINVGKLESFTSTPLFQALPTDEQVRLRVQLFHMRGYNDALKQRITHFELAD